MYREKLMKIQLLVEKYLETLIEKILSEKILIKTFIENNVLLKLTERNT